MINFGFHNLTKVRKQGNVQIDVSFYTYTINERRHRVWSG